MEPAGGAAAYTPEAVAACEAARDVQEVELCGPTLDSGGTRRVTARVANVLPFLRRTRRVNQDARGTEIEATVHLASGIHKVTGVYEMCIAGCPVGPEAVDTRNVTRYNPP